MISDSGRLIVNYRITFGRSHARIDCLCIHPECRDKAPCKVGHIASLVESTNHDECNCKIYKPGGYIRNRCDLYGI